MKFRQFLHSAKEENFFPDVHQCAIQRFCCRGYRIFSMCVNNFKRYCDYNGNDEFRAYESMAWFVCKDAVGEIQTDVTLSENS